MSRGPDVDSRAAGGGSTTGAVHATTATIAVTNSSRISPQSRTITGYFRFESSEALSMKASMLSGTSYFASSAVQSGPQPTRAMPSVTTVRFISVSLVEAERQSQLRNALLGHGCWRYRPPQ